MNHPSQPKAWIRARSDFKCGSCGKSDWCTYHPTLYGGPGWCCMRNTSSTPMKNGGYWHPLTAAPRFVPKAPPPEPTINCNEIIGELRDITKWEWIEELGRRLRVLPWTLKTIGVMWAPQKVLCRFMPWNGKGSWAFPMLNGEGRAVGIRLRTNDGQKISIRGGRDGIFVPQMRADRTAFIVEGPTDTAACLSLGVFGLGRPNCRGAIAHTQVTINRLNIARAIVIGEPDVPKWQIEKSPGIEGAKRLASELQIPVASMLLPSKDMRKFVELGGTRSVLDAMVKHLTWRQPNDQRNEESAPQRSVPVA